MPITTQALRDSLTTTSAVARAWFEDRAGITQRDQFSKRGGLADEGLGAVYAYFTAEGSAVYVGQTGRRVKARLHDVTSPHKKKHWWGSWTYMRFLPLTDSVDRRVLESLLIAGYEPTGNEKPRAKCISEMLPL